MSDSDSLSLHDINFDDSDSFNYVDYNLCSAQIRAVLNNDLSLLQNLIENGKSVNVNDNRGNTPLHHSILTNNKEIFEFLLNVEKIRRDVQNFEGQTPLILAARHKLKEFSHELIKRGADVNLVEPNGENVLHHWASEDKDHVRLLIDRGVDLNATNFRNRTPLHVACLAGNAEIVELLVEAGADCNIPDNNSSLPFTISLTKLPENHQNLLFLMTYDSQSSVNLATLTEVMFNESKFFTELIQLKITYSRFEVDCFVEYFINLSPQMLRIFQKRYERLFNHILISRGHEIFYHFAPNSNIAPIFLILESPHITEIVEHLNRKRALTQLIESQLSEDALSQIVFGLLSFGLEILLYDLLLVLWHYGHRELFKLLLHHPVQACSDSGLYDVCCYLLENQNSLRDLLVLLERFNSSEAMRRSFDDTFWREESVPSLVKLAAVVSRDFLIEKFQITSHVKFFTILKNLQVPEYIRKILACEVVLY